MIWPRLAAKRARASRSSESPTVAAVVVVVVVAAVVAALKKFSPRGFLGRVRTWVGERAPKTRATATSWVGEKKEEKPRVCGGNIFPPRIAALDQKIF